MKDKILLFIPMYNCEKQITRVLDQFNDEVCRYIQEIIILNNRSTDDGEQVVAGYLDTHEILTTVKLLRNDENYGLGGSQKLAFDYAVKNGFDYVIMLHGDDQGSIEDLIPYIRRGIHRKYDCLLGARFMNGSRLKGYSAFRTFGNVVYNILFSLGVGQRVLDLGSGLNMYSTAMLKDRFYIKYKDNLMFNYCMILGSAYYGHNIRFFPICWREDDQVSNVKMMNQAVTVLKLLGSYIINKKKFIEAEHRDNVVEAYTAKIIAEDLYQE
ncbi:MAG: glycosyltransferase family 2 protein [Lachnospiraceae bacterium]|nr:glycosyltransferase family 2 protein [Lachnospiraceae bacterium]